MATKIFTGFLRDPLSEFANKDKFRFTHISTTGEVIAGSISLFEVSADGEYTIGIQYGNVLIESRDKLSHNWIRHGVKTINADTVVTTLPSLLNAITPVTEAIILQMESLLADTELAASNAVNEKITVSNVDPIVTDGVDNDVWFTV